MAFKPARLSVMDSALPNERSDKFGFHFARVHEVIEVFDHQQLIQIATTKSFMHSVCPLWRSAENIETAHWIIWDVDCFYSADEVIQRLLKSGYSFIVISSLNHQKEKLDRSGIQKPACDRFRVIFPLAEQLANRKDYSETSKSLCRELNLDCDKLDPASFSIAGRWQPGHQVLAQNPTGKPVAIKRAPSIKKNPAPVTGSGKGRLRNRTLNFLNGQSTKGWHYDLLFACADLKSALYSKAEAISELEKATLGKGLDRHHDLYQIDYVYERSSFVLDYLPPWPSKSKI